MFGTRFVSKQRGSPFCRDLDLSFVGLVGNLLLVEQLLNPIPTTNHVSKKSLEEVEVTHFLPRIWLLQFPSEQLSGYNKLGVVREEWWHSIVSDRTSILSSEQDECRPNIVFWCFFHALCMSCARRGAPKSIVSGSLCSLSIGSTGRKNTVCLLLKICPPGINPELMMECKLIAHPISCNEGSLRLRPEWPWRARRYSIVPEESAHYWSFLVSSSSSCQGAHPLFVRPNWWQNTKWSWR